jgi:putative sigma-54 modulation protein
VALDLMTVDEALDAMEAVGHDFFVFREMESDSIQIVYRRESEGYGVLVPVKRE